MRANKKAQKFDRQFQGMAGTVIDYGHPKQKLDHLVKLDDWDMNRWFSIDELDGKEGLDADSVSIATTDNTDESQGH